MVGNTLMVSFIEMGLIAEMYLFLYLTCPSPGSGGNNHAVEHYEKTKYPLAVKLGTITPDGADVFSYDEDDMVIDPLLAQHLAHFGIDIALMTKVFW